MGRAANSEIPRLGAAAKREGNDVVELQQEAGPAAAPAVRIDVAAAAAVAAPHLAPHRCGNVAGSTRPAGRLRAAPGRAGCLWPRPRTAIELRHFCPLRRRRSAATTIRYCQRGGHALVCRRCRPWSRYSGVGPTIGNRLRRGSSDAGRHRHWPGRHRGAAAASPAPRRGAGAARPTRGLLRGQRCPRRGAGAARPRRGLLRGRHCPRRLLVPAPPVPGADSSADSVAGAEVLPPALVPSGVGGTPGCSCAPRFAGEVAPPAGPSCAVGSGAWPALASRRPPRRPRRGRPGS